jgi:hypothetical protein
MFMEVTDKTEALETTNRAIADNEEFLEGRKSDLAKYEASLIVENENFDRITALYEDLVS